MGRLASEPERGKESLSDMRKMIRTRRVSFPSQVPVFARLHRPDLQWRIVLLYFVRGWPSGRIAVRYGITRERVRQILRHWISRARSLGYIDLVPSEDEFAWRSAVLPAGA